MALLSLALGVLRVLVVLVLVGGCATVPGTGSPVPSTPSTPPSTAATTPPTTTPPPLPTAADGVDLTSCADGVCEVRAAAGEAIPLGERSEIDLQVEEIDGDDVVLTGTWPGGSARSIGDCRRCSTAVSSGGSGPATFRVTLQAGAGVMLNDTPVLVVALGDAEVVLRIGPS